jgi:hypothetical protein
MLVLFLMPAGIVLGPWRFYPPLPAGPQSLLLESFWRYD